MVDDNKPDLPDDEAERRFQQTLGRLVNTAHKPHGKSPSAAKKTGAKGGKGG